MEGLNITPCRMPDFLDWGSVPIEFPSEDAVSDEIQDRLNALHDFPPRKRKPRHPLSDKEYAKKILGCRTYSGRSANIYTGVLQAVCRQEDTGMSYLLRTVS